MAKRRAGKTHTTPVPMEDLSALRILQKDRLNARRAAKAIDKKKASR